MKTIYNRLFRWAILCAMSFIEATTISAQNQNPSVSSALVPAKRTPPPPTAYQVTEQGANFRVWERTVYEYSPSGQLKPKKHAYIELAGGLNYKKAGQWVESKEEIEAFSSGAIARQGQYQVIFANNLNTAGAIDQQTPDGKRLRSNILGLAYYDSASGQSVMIAQIHDSQGELISSNQVLYPNAFTGVKADVRYTYKIGSFEQDVILREQPPTPETYGLDSRTTEIEVFTEFIDPPEANIRRHPGSDASISDMEISWGAMRIGRGKAFQLPDDERTGSPIRVRRAYMTVEGRNILIESVSRKKIESSLKKLSARSSPNPRMLEFASKSFSLPKIPKKAAGLRSIRTAAVMPPSSGFVLDYVELGSDQSDYTFQGDTTYYISGSLDISGPEVFEGGSVLKFASGVTLNLNGLDNNSFATGAYRPVVFTAKDDNTVGEILSGSDGVPSGYYGFIQFDSGNAVSMHDAKFKYLEEPINIDGANGNSLMNVSIQNCDLAVYIGDDSSFLFGNILINNANEGFQIGNSEGVIEHLTMDHCGALLEYGGNGETAYFTNCIFASVTNMTPYWDLTDTAYGSDNGFYSSPEFGSLQYITNASPFQIAGGGAHYLADGNYFRQAGTTNIDPSVLADIAGRTTYAPVYFLDTNIYLGVNTTFGPAVGRDNSGPPDLGYHYDALDYIISPIYVTNATVLINGGAAVGFYGIVGSYNYGIAVATNAGLTCQGTANNPVWMVAYNSVQEQTPTNWMTPSYGLVTHYDNSQDFQISSRFTHWSVIGQDDYTFQIDGGTNALDCQDSEFYGGQILSLNPTINFTNCLLWRVDTEVFAQDNNTPNASDNTVVGGQFGFVSLTATNSVVQNNLFDHAGVPFSFGDVPTTYAGGYNAFVTNCDRLTPHIASDIILTASPAYQASWFGGYYLPPGSPLINAGSTTADQVGLYHFTTQTNQVPETNSVVDIGYHYVATDSYGNPLDTNGDGIPDYIEDANGNGLVDSGEIGWNIVGDLGLQVIISQPRNGSTIP